ncbi:protein Wnt-6-like [Aplysia californica]|uniref:Protein Wnt n=1 Tax=Aplysia californica TaxID=6500 RepID=A0ABM1VR40_APLCA|nr:protein Wnt-6-like [Aplysia californica]
MTDGTSEEVVPLCSEPFIVRLDETVVILMPEDNASVVCGASARAGSAHAAGTRQEAQDKGSQRHQVVGVKNFMRRECKCHGLSGSCTLKTCWKKMPPFREVGNRLKERFDGAIRVIISNDGKNIIPEGLTIKPPSRHDLVYSDPSPDFCKKNKKVGSLGTRGRECEPDSMGVGGCDLLCCNRGYSRTSVTMKENCKCRFLWCCEVICETCVSTKILNKCL